MHIVIFNDNDTPVQFREDSVHVRAAYLLGEKVALAGNYFIRLDDRKKGIIVKRTMASVPLNNKIKMVKRYFEILGLPLDIDLDDIKKQAENFAKAKNKLRAYIGAYRKYEHAFTQIFLKIVEWFDEQIEQSGYYELAKLLNEPTVQCLSVNYFNPEYPTKKEFKPSNIISLNFEPFDNSKIFSLTEYFFESPFADSFKYVAADHEDASLEHIVYLEPLLKIADLNKLKAAELTFVRESLKSINQQFYEKTDEWINMCYCRKPFEERKLLLQEEVLPIAYKFSELINSNPHMQHVKIVADEEQTLEIFIGEVPFQLLLDYHWHYKIITKETFARIKVLQEKEERLSHNKRWPVLFFKQAKKSNPEPDKIDLTGLSKLFKKSIPIN